MPGERPRNSLSLPKNRVPNCNVLAWETPTSRGTSRPLELSAAVPGAPPRDGSSGRCRLQRDDGTPPRVAVLDPSRSHTGNSASPDGPPGGAPPARTARGSPSGRGAPTVGAGRRRPSRFGRGPDVRASRRVGRRLRRRWPFGSLVAAARTAASGPARPVARESERRRSVPPERGLRPRTDVGRLAAATTGRAGRPGPPAVPPRRIRSVAGSRPVSGPPTRHAAGRVARRGGTPRSRPAGRRPSRRSRRGCTSPRSADRA